MSLESRLIDCSPAHISRVPNEYASFPVLQGVAVLGIALIAMGEEIGAEMALRTFGHLVSLVLCQWGGGILEQSHVAVSGRGP